MCIHCQIRIISSSSVFPFPHSILTLNTNTSFCLTCHHLLMKIINIIMRDRWMRKPEASLRPALVPFNAGMWIVPVYSFSQLIYYCSGDVIPMPGQKGCDPMFQQWMFTLEMTVGFYLNPCPLPLPVRRFYRFPSVFTQKFAFSSINFFRFLSSGTYLKISVKLVLRRENWFKTLETRKEIAMKNFFLGGLEQQNSALWFFSLVHEWFALL